MGSGKYGIFILMWMLFLAIKIPTLILGFIVVPFLWQYRETLYENLPSLTRPWSNPEDWMGGPKGFENSLPKWWVDKEGSGFWSFYKYHAIRNGANGLRSFEFLDLDIDMKKVKYVTPVLLTYYEPWHMRKLSPPSKKAKYWCWQGWKAGFKYVRLWNEERHLVIKMGWRVQPQDAHKPIDPTGIRHKDSGFATKFLAYRKG